MSVWQLGAIKFDTYGIHVSSSHGVLDFPKLTDEGHNWLDENAKSYWKPYTALKKSDRDIALYCWIDSDSYTAFKSEAQAFFDAIKTLDKSTLVTPYTSVDDVALHNEIAFIRESNYVDTLQIGTFILRLTVMGDTQFDYVNICRDYLTTIIATVKTKNLKIYKSLQGVWKATMSFESNTKLAIQYFDFIYLNSNGVNNDIFHLESEPEFQKISTNKYVYNLEFLHQQNWLSHSQFLFDAVATYEADFYYFATMEEIVDLILTNHTRTGFNKFLKGTVASTERRNHKFSAEDCFSVLKRIAGEYDLEYEFEFVPATVQYYINVKSSVANTKAVTLQYGKGNGLYQITRGEMMRDKLVTRLYAYGAARNLKPDYRSGLQRLSFDGNPLTSNDGLNFSYGELGNIERSIYFDDEYPNRSSTVTEYYQVLPVPGEATYEAIKEVFPEGIYRITDSSLDFDINDYLLGGLTAKVRMKTGDCAGVELEISRYDHDYTHIYLIPFKDERGYEYPNVVLMPAIGDEYTLVDIDQPTTYVTTAEDSLKAAASAYIAEYSIPKYPYNARIDPAFTGASGYEVGDYLTVVDTDYNISGQFRISELTYDNYTEVYDLTLSDQPVQGRIQKIETTLNEINRTNKDTKNDQVEKMREIKESTNELRNRTFDPVDDRFNVDRNVRSESIDPRMLSFDAGVPQFQVRGCLVETNYGGEANAVHVSSGFIDILNWPDNVLTRYEIYKAVDLEGGTYDPRRTWNIAATDITLLTDAGYYLIAKLPRATLSTTGTIYASEDYTLVKNDKDYIYHMLGYINQAASPRVPAMLWGNVKMNAETLTELLDPRLFADGQAIYLHQEDSDIAGCDCALRMAPDDPLTVYSASGADGDFIIQEFATESGFPGVKIIPPGVWVFEHYMTVTEDDDCSLTVKTYKRNTSGEETELFNINQAVTSPGTVRQQKAIVNNQFELDTSDRLVFKYYATFGSTTPHTMYLDIEGDASGEYRWSNVRIPDLGLADASSEDNYVDGLSFDEGTRTLTLNRTGSLADLTVEIPGSTGEGVNTFLNLTDTPDSYLGQSGKVVAVSSGEDSLVFKNVPSMSRFDDFEFCVTAGATAQYEVDIYAAFVYTITKAIIKCDQGTMDAISLEIDSVSVAGCDDMDIDSSATVFTATADNEVSEGSLVTLTTSGTDSGTPTSIRLKIVYEA